LLVWALATAAGLGVLLFALGGFDLGVLIDPTRADPTLIGSVESRAFRVFQPLFVVIPVALFVGIMRYRIWDIDLVISRALVYGALAALIGSAYVGVVVGLGGAIGSQTGLSIAVTVAVALAFDPLRSRLQRLANRLIYGERATPYDVLSEVAHRLADATSPDDALEAIAEAAGRAVGGVRARARLELPDRAGCEAFWPSADGDAPFDRTVDVVHQERKIGDIAVAKKVGDPLRPAENRLLEALAGQVGLALQSLRLAEQLRIRLGELEVAARELSGSRGRLMRAADAERRRLEQLIHEGVERELEAIGDALKIAEKNVARDAVRATDELERIAEQANHTQEALRALARGIFPPLLSDKGVGAALQSHLRKLEATVTMSGTLDERFDARAEAAVYFCCIEALRPMSRATAGASAATVELGRENGWVRFAVRNAAGLTATSAEVQLLVDRIEAVGGTLVVRTSDGETEVAGRVPATTSATDPADQIADQTLVSLSGSKADLGT
jgi:signal transduction histidine kinase